MIFKYNEFLSTNTQTQFYENLVGVGCVVVVILFDNSYLKVGLGNNYTLKKNCHLNYLFLNRVKMICM